MKVLVHLNHGINKSYLLCFERNMTAQSIKEILGCTDPDHAIKRLLMYSSKRMEVSPKDRQKAEKLAHFTISQRGYTFEQLA